MGSASGDRGSVGAVIAVAVDRKALRRWLVASCKAQGVPLLISDATVAAQVGALLREGVSDGSEAARDSVRRQRRQTGLTRRGSRTRAPGLPGPMVA